jgi:catechol 2,3-dioxygenase-like lactoylglutathione lyase family enzyme
MYYSTRHHRRWTQMPKLKSTAATFPVADIESTIRWYENELGFTAYPFPQTPPYVFAIVSRDTVEIMFQRVPGFQKPDLYNRRAGGVWDAYIRMEGVKEFYESLKDKVEIVLPLRQQPYGDWEFEVKDPNGYVLVFSELIEEA